MSEQELLHIFIDNLEQDVDALIHSFQTGDDEQWDAMAHKLYGSCSHIGAYALAAACNDAQALSSAPPETDQAAEMKHAHDAILYHFDRLQDVLKDKMAA